MIGIWIKGDRSLGSYLCTLNTPYNERILNIMEDKMAICEILLAIGMVMWIVMMLMVALWSWTQYKVAQKQIETTNEMIHNEMDKYR